MTTETQTHEEHHDPPYMLIWLVLLVMTMAEVGYAFLSLPKFWLALGLCVMAIWKAILVAFVLHAPALGAAQAVDLGRCPHASRRHSDRGGSHGILKVLIPRGHSLCTTKACRSACSWEAC